MQKILGILSFFRLLSRNMHENCLNSFYPKTNGKVKREHVPNDKILWTSSFPEYTPLSYTSHSILARPSFADPDLNDPSFKPVWNKVDGCIDRRSHEGSYELVSGMPRNYKGRTGIAGRGCLGRWGPNHAADPVVTRWKLDISGNIIVNRDSNKRVLEFVSIERRDCGQWAIPGGMVDPGEKISSTLKREFLEEALNSNEMNEGEKKEAQGKLHQLFDSGVKIYSGYVDDPRNTDNAWMETVAYHFHDSEGSVLHNLKLTAGDDAKSVRWSTVTRDLSLYASHKNILIKAAERVNAHW